MRISDGPTLSAKAPPMEHKVILGLRNREQNRTAFGSHSSAVRELYGDV